MTHELLQGTPKQLKDRLDAIVAAVKTVHHVIPLADKSWYLIIWS